MNYTPREVAKHWFGGKSNLQAVTLRKWNIAAAVILAVQGVAVLLFSGSYMVSLYVAHVTGDALQTKLHGVPVTAPALHELWRLNLTYLVAATLVVSAVGYLLATTVWRERYEGWLKKGFGPLRWVLMGVAGSLLAVTIGLLVGVNELEELKLIAASVIITSLCGAWLELKPSRRKPDASGWIGLAIAIIAGAMLWLSVLVTMLSTIIFGGIGVVAYGWLIFAAMVIGWLLIAGNAYLVRIKRGKWGNYLYGEAWYIGLVVVIETLFAWGLFAAALHP